MANISYLSVHFNLYENQCRKDLPKDLDCNKLAKYFYSLPSQLWLGDHPSHGTKVILPGIEHARKKILLHDWLILNPRQLELQSRDDVCDSRLPFLLKVLSIRSPLALQAHPDKVSKILKTVELEQHSAVLHTLDRDRMRQCN